MILNTYLCLLSILIQFSLSLLKSLQTYHSFISLTALWAFVESGLGGMMHAFHIPFTGIVLGGFSILIVSLLAQIQKPVFGQILQATLIVIAVKATVNPMTPPTAYIAVGFQGLCGALLFSIQRRNMVLSLIFSITTMIESAIQKLLVLTLLFGNELWNAVDAYIHNVTKMFGLRAETAGSKYFVVGYISLFAIWGIILGIWTYYLPAQLDQREHDYKHILPETAIAESPKKEKGKQKLGIIVLGILFICLSFFIGKSSSPVITGLTLLIRTLCIVLLWLYLVLPLWSKMMQTWLQKQKDKYEEINAVLIFIPQISSYVKPLYRYAAANHQGIKKWKEFVLSLMVVSLNLGNEK